MAWVSVLAPGSGSAVPSDVGAGNVLVGAWDGQVGNQMATAPKLHFPGGGRGPVGARC
jgi:hypothetical protein